MFVFGRAESFFVRHRADLPAGRGLTHVLHALVVLDYDLTPGTVLALLRRAGLAEQAEGGLIKPAAAGGAVRGGPAGAPPDPARFGPAGPRS